MTTLYQDLRARAESRAKDQFLAVPIIPTLGMMIAAAETTNVFREGDRLWEYFEKYDDERDRNDLFLDEALVERFGVQKAFVIACLADVWGACLQGVDLWLRDRGRSNMAAHAGRDLIYYPPNSCPKGGWPDKKEDVTDEQKAHARCTTEPYGSFYTAWYGDYDRETVTIAPRRLPTQPCQTATQVRLSVSAWAEFSDVFDLSKTPFVPGWTKDGYFDEEETAEILVAAMWRSAISWLLSEDQPDDQEFPYHPNQQAVMLSHIAYNAKYFSSGGPDFLMSLPCDRFSITTDKAVLSFSAANGYSSYWYQEAGESKRMIRNEGLVLRVGCDKSGLTDLLRKVCKDKITSVEAIPMTVPWDNPS